MEKTIHNEQNIETSFDGKIMLRLLSYAKSQGIILFFSIIMMLAVTGVDLAVPYVIKVAIDEFITPSSQVFYQVPSEGRDQFQNNTTVTVGATTYALPSLKDTFIKNNDAQIVPVLTETNGSYKLPDGSILDDETIQLLKTHHKSLLKNLTLVLASLLILSFLMTYTHALLLNYASQKIVYTLREALFDHLQIMSLSFFDKNPVGRLVTRVSNDMNNINEMFTNVLITSVKDFFLLGGTVVVMVMINMKLAVICLSTIPLILIAASIFRVKARAIQREVKVKLARINATLAENINGMKIIQIFNKETSIYNAFDDINKDYLKSSVAETRVYAIFRPAMNLVYSISLALLLWFGGNDAIRGAVDLGVLVAFISYTQQFFRPIMDLSEKFNIFQSSMASAERVFMLLDEENPIENPENPVILPEETFEGVIEFKDVWFSYQDDPQKDEDYVLKGVSFKVQKGETIALVGSTGSGKTTIISLLNRFYDIHKGAILVDGIDIRQMDLASLRRKIGIVLQDVFLFSGDIKSNIRLKEEAITLKAIQTASTYVNADTFISKLPHGYDEPVVERGATLSSGQRQLLSFARALVFEPKILILDEATSNIDTETELLIQDAIQKMIHKQTTIIVAHRLSTIQHANKILVMSRGEIKETGTHQELLSKEGIYYDLYMLQMKA
ncbi:ABC transporter ATP-binding protein [Fusibacter ferrireducens]|uniref:ABC transporter ATP-binding protein n=1 Tax=Fusibacter ferrireducens TaxID=2785058 RepID=A0ABR9ZYV4_9FIRM|nr:ABC transporter ATP-binding protein [Fusibacter ferrireducens]MBF4695070.1 ABC transporter ATP-binding protein [Fusibacter ferrireducens]